MSKVPLTNMQGESLGEWDVADELLVFDKGQQALKESIVALQAAQRAGTASTKTKGTVAGSGKKPWKQKGTGRARAGYRRSPVWRGGGVAFGPHPRDYVKSINKKMARLAFQRAFSEKIAAGQVTILDELTIEQPKTRLLTGLAKTLHKEDGVLLVVDQVGDALALASRNLVEIGLATSAELNVYHLLYYPAVVITKAAMGGLEKRLRAPVRRGA